MSYGFKNLFRFPFHFRVFDVRNKHQFYRNYINEVENKLLLDRKQLEDAYEKAKEEAENDEQADAIDSAYQDLWDENYEFMPSLLYGSIFLSLYGYFEGILKNCYEDCVTTHGYGYPAIQKKKKSIDDYKGFFNKHNLYAFSKDKDNFKFINDCEVIRDKLMHTNGEMTEEEMNGVRQTFAKYNSIHIRLDRFAIVRKDILLQLNDVVKDVLEPLCDHLYRTIEEYQPRNL